MPRTHKSHSARRAPALLGDVPIPDKLYFRIGEVGRLTQTKAYVLRYWETEFPMLKPVKARTGHRLYRRQDVETVLKIKHLLYGQGFTIDGARKKLAGNTANGPVESAGQPGLFSDPVVDGKHVKAIKRELESILTMLSRKC